MISPRPSTVRREFWKLLHKSWLPQLVNIIRYFHEGMVGSADNGSMSDPFPVANRSKEGCVLAPLHFGIMFLGNTTTCFTECQIVMQIQFRTDDIFYRHRLRAKTKEEEILIRDLLYADHCLCSHTRKVYKQSLPAFHVHIHGIG